MDHPKQRLITTYFHTEEEAWRKAKAIQALSKDAIVDVRRIDQLSQDASTHRHTLSGHIQSLADLTLSSNQPLPDTARMLSSHVMASGMADGHVSEVGRDIALTVLIDASLYDQAANILNL